MTRLADQIDALLPQTQCGQCGYAGCRPYAEALAAGLADLDQCPPGGDEGVEGLAALLQRPAKPVNPANGVHKPVASVAFIEEALCIGCMRCIQACPVDAIVGANKLMHTVISDQCTGCELCLPPCPVDCIVMEPVAAAAPARDVLMAMAPQSRQRHQARQARLARRDAERNAERERRKQRPAPQPLDVPAIAPALDPVAAALARARARRAS